MLSKLQAYKACFYFLDTIWRKDKALYLNDLPVLLGSMDLCEDDTSRDSAILEDWNELIAIEHISAQEGYHSVKRFLQSGEEHTFYNNVETKIVVEKMELEYEMMWQLWVKSIARVSDDK